jgi:hypothetical protein
MGLSSLFAAWLLLVRYHATPVKIVDMEDRAVDREQGKPVHAAPIGLLPTIDPLHGYLQVRRRVCGRIIREAAMSNAPPVDAFIAVIDNTDMLMTP